MKKLDYNSPVVLTYAIAAALALALNRLTGGWTNAHLFSVYRCSPLDPLACIRLFGHAIGHSGWSHYAGNFMMILLLGPALEEKYGGKRLLLFMLATAAVTGLVHMLVSPAGLLGASGIVFMMIVLSSCAGLREGRVPITLLLILAIYLGEQVVTGFTVHDHISQLGHIVGGVCGAVFGLTFSERRGGYGGESRENRWLRTGKL